MTITLFPNQNTDFFALVKNNQFFICPDGNLCQKISYTSYQRIADNNGVPYAQSITLTGDAGNWLINKILPEVTCIKF
jgi:hypothetical protein